MALTAEEIETVREITLETSLSDITVLCSELTAEQTTRLSAIIEDWDAIRFRNGDLIPSRDNELFFAQEEKRRQVRHTVRLMLGLPAISNTEIAIAEINGMYGSLTGGMVGKGNSGGTGAAEFGMVTSGGIGGVGELGG